MKVIAVVWCCPRCANYYASSSAGNLHTTMNTDLKGEPTFPRSQCPDCRAQGHTIERIPHRVEIMME